MDSYVRREPLATVGIGLAFIYRYGPSRRDARWRWVSWGSLEAALLWMGASMLFSWYVVTFDSCNRPTGLSARHRLYGLVVDIRCDVLLGAELNAEMEHQTAHDTTQAAPSPSDRDER
ncbi:YhjD/YihY/BrkB family envelope integrity protein [Allomesorhizobium alhagi]|uniref:YihY/virulence factor BrkB family protein n=1 Tax=Allomesorhizobium alhagi TaxID=475067 RepID=UPI000A2EFA7F